VDAKEEQPSEPSRGKDGAPAAPQSAIKQGREERLAKALRENLRRRKAARTKDDE
jgi:hypothetical protein